MKKIFLIIIGCLFCICCGVKDEPKYSQKSNNKKIYITI